MSFTTKSASVVEIDAARSAVTTPVTVISSSRTGVLKDNTSGLRSAKR